VVEHLPVQRACGPRFVLNTGGGRGTDEQLVALSC
jgi:hypothetical protein